MFCILELGMFAAGIVLLVAGKLPVTANREVRGASARVVGAIFLLPLLIGGVGGFAYGFVVGAQKGFERAAQHQNRPMTPQEYQQMQQEIRQKVMMPALVLEIGSTVVSLLLGVGIALATMQPIKKKKRRRVRWEEEDDEDDEDEGYEDSEPAPRARRRRRPPEDEDEG
ncbi:MAG TPA: hypothetical protein VJ739_10145 [Gemmataceae bacterium]|nr:hypothetical protein [Gemmataceae bacterium]